MIATGKSILIRYAAAVATVAVSIALKALLTPLTGPDLRFITLFPAVVLSALYGGFGAGLLATALGGVAANYFLASPAWSLGLSSLSDVAQLAIFFLMGAFISWIASDWRRIHGALEQVENESELRSKDSERALRESEERSLLAQRSTGVGIWEWDLATDEVFWSEGIFGLLGLESQNERTTLQNWERFIIEDDRRRAIDHIRRMIEEGSDEFYDEFRVSRQDNGRVIWMATKGSIIRENGRASRLLGVNFDISETKTTEIHINKLNKELNRRIRELRTIIDITPVGIAVAQDASCDVITANPALAKMVGVAPGTNISKNRASHSYKHIKDGRELAPHELPMQRAVAEKRPIMNEEIDIVRADGSTITIYGYAAPVLDEDGNVVSCVAAQIDVSDRKQLELERERKLEVEQMLRREAEEANRLIDEFLATVSHELRTPLNAIIGWIAVLRDKELNEAVRKRAVEAIERGANSQSQLIEDLLDVSRIISGKLQLQPEPVNLVSVVNAALEIVRPAAEAKGIDLNVDYGDAAAAVCGDQERLQQVIWNLLSNAIKFTPSGGRAEVSLGHKNGFVEIQVSDTGKGIPADFLPHVFDRFRQADGSITRSFTGLGLGLAIVRHLVELHGGTVNVESAGEDKGATFTIQLPELPIAESAGDDRKSADFDSVEHPLLDGVRVLVVDDEADTREILRLAFERCRASVLDASSADEGFKKFKSWKPQVIISDIGMPGRDGYAFIRDVRDWEGTESNGTQVPAIALTAYARETDRTAALDAGFEIHVAKPVEPARITRLAADLLDKR